MNEQQQMSRSGQKINRQTSGCVPKNCEMVPDVHTETVSGYIFNPELSLFVNS